MDNLRFPKKRIAMMEKYNFTYNVQPPGPSFDKHPLAMVGWRDDPVHKKLTAEIDRANDPEALKTALEHQAALRRPIPFPEYVEKGLAVYIKPYVYSFAQLVRAIAQQEGSGHEETSLDEPLAQMRQIAIGGHPSHLAVLIGFANDVLKVGISFIEFVAGKHGYAPKYFKRAI